MNVDALQADWAEFASKLPQHLRDLDRMRIHYRVAPPGARITSGLLEANSELPDQVMEYRLKGGPWIVYRSPVRVAERWSFAPDPTTGGAAAGLSRSLQPAAARAAPTLAAVSSSVKMCTRSPSDPTDSTCARAT